MPGGPRCPGMPTVMRAHSGYPHQLAYGAYTFLHADDGQVKQHCLFRRECWQIGPRRSQGIIRQAVILGLIDFWPIEGEQSPAQVNLVSLEENDFPDTQAMIEKQTHEQAITLCQTAGRRVFELIQQLHRNINGLGLLIPDAGDFTPGINVSGLLAPDALHSLDVGMRIHIEKPRRVSQVAIGFDGGQPHIDTTDGIALQLLPFNERLKEARADSLPGREISVQVARMHTDTVQKPPKGQQVSFLSPDGFITEALLIARQPGRFAVCIGHGGHIRESRSGSLNDCLGILGHGSPAFQFFCSPALSQQAL